MKTRKSIYTKAFMTFLACMILVSGCKKSSTSTTSSGPSFVVVNLVADVGSFSASKIDTNLINAWGVAISPTGKVWVSSAGKGVTTIYDGTGATLIAPVKIPAEGGRASSGPTGAMFNNTAEFIIPADNTVSKFIYVNLDGTISAWSTGTAAKTVANRSAQGASYTGAALGKVGNTNYLYAANFAGGKVDVFTSNFTYNISFSFVDPNLPQGLAPYNVANIGGDLYVTYAPASYNASGNGVVDVFSPDGTFIKRFATNTGLNFPWGITMAPAGFGVGLNMILVGNFGDGTISIFDQNGVFKGQLSNNGTAISIDGLWSLTAAPSTATSLNQNVVYFTAGPNSGGHGVFGYLNMVAVTTSGSGGYGY
jgi:uncharacterized protein (TIGR03118 family)